MIDDITPFGHLEVEEVAKNALELCLRPARLSKSVQDRFERSPERRSPVRLGRRDIYSDPGRRL